MRRYSEAAEPQASAKQWADVWRGMSRPHRQSEARISEELSIHVITLYKLRKTWWLQGDVMPASQKDPEGWSAVDKFTHFLSSLLGWNYSGIGA